MKGLHSEVSGETTSVIPFLKQPTNQKIVNKRSQARTATRFTGDFKTVWSRKSMATQRQW